MKLCMASYLLLTSEYTSTIANQEAYSVPSDFLKIEGVFIKNAVTNNYRRLRPIDPLRRDPREQTGDPGYYYLWGRNVSGANSDTINLNPIPSTSGTSDLIIFIRQTPLTMVNGGQGPEIPLAFQNALPAYALWKIYQRDHAASVPLADRYQGEWRDWIHEAIAFRNPLQNDMPIPVEDVMGYTQMWG